MTHKRWRQDLAFKTRDPQFLWAIAGINVGLGVLVGLLLHSFAPESFSRTSVSRQVAGTPLSGDDVTPLVEALLASGSERFELFDHLVGLHLLVAESEGSGAAIQIESALSLAKLPGRDREVAMRQFESLRRGEVTRDLASLAAAEPVIPYANFATATVSEAIGKSLEAAMAYEREARETGLDEAKRRAIATYIRIEALDDATRLVDDPSFAPHVDGPMRRSLAATTGDWWTLWWLIPASFVDHDSWGSAALALLAGTVWFVFLLQAGRFLSLRCSAFWICLSAVALGVLSVWPTLMLVWYEELALGLVESKELGDGLRFFVVGVGLREELCKLLLFAPLLPWLLRKRDDLTALISAACVGLGFAVEENIGYFEGSLGTATVGRFLTANFFHMSLTGLSGLWLYRGCRWPRECGPQAVAVFGVVVFAHGLYDAFGTIEYLYEYAIVGWIIFLLLAYQFFHELRQMWQPRYDPVSLTATFVFGLSTLMGATFAYVAYRYGFSFAVNAFAAPSLQMALFAYVYLREMPESLVRT